MTNPIDQPDFHPLRARDPNPETIARIRRLAAKSRKDHFELVAAVREAKEAGHSYQQLAEAAGVSIGVIQRMVQ